MMKKRRCEKKIGRESDERATQPVPVVSMTSVLALLRGPGRIYVCDFFAQVETLEEWALAVPRYVEYLAGQMCK